MSERDNAVSRVPTPTTPPTVIPIGNVAAIDLSGLPEAQRAELLKTHAAGMLDIAKKAQELSVDVGALRATLDVATNTAKDASAAGNSVTISHVVDSKAGRTEVMIGNTDAAHSGKLSARQAGVKDWKPIYVLVGIAAVVIIFALLRH